MLTEIILNNASHWYYTTGNHPDKCLIVVHGGPGFAMMPLFHQHVPELENYFTVVNYDQRGAGRSYHKKIATATMTLKNLVADLHALITHLKQTYQQIYLLGHSTGTMICTTLVTQYPDLAKYYIGVGQVTHVGLNEENTYNKVLTLAKQQKNQQAIAELSAIGQPNADHDYSYDKDDGYDVTEKWIDYFGYELYGQRNLDAIYEEINASEIYSKHLRELNKGYEFSQHLWDDDEMNAYEMPLAYKIPVLFLHGSTDYTTSVDLIEQYYPRITAPKKDLVIFERAAHFPFLEVPKQFSASILNHLLLN